MSRIGKYIQTETKIVGPRARSIWRRWGEPTNGHGVSFWSQKCPKLDCGNNCTAL